MTDLCEQKRLLQRVYICYDVPSQFVMDDGNNLKTKDDQAFLG